METYQLILIIVVVVLIIAVLCYSGICGKGRKWKVYPASKMEGMMVRIVMIVMTVEMVMIKAIDFLLNYSFVTTTTGPNSFIFRKLKVIEF